jgi:LacI family transcriptional regulator
MGRRPSGRVTIDDVALEAGVSVSTVSRVIRNHVDVHADTRAAVLAAIETLGYRPSPIARALVSGETRMLALLVSDFTNPFYPQLAMSIEREADKAGYTVVICSTGDRTEQTRRHLTRLLGQGLDGVIHAAVGRDEATVLAVLGDHRRVVFTNRPPKSKAVSYVVSDNFEGAAELTRHLLAIGHRRIGFIGGPPYAVNATERLRGFTTVMKDVAEATALVMSGEFARESGERAVKQWLQEGSAPTAIIAINDSVALGAMEALIRGGLRIPADIALAGFDGTNLAASPIMSLTSVDQRSEEMGRLAVGVLLGQLRSDAFVPTQQVLPTQLLLRASTEDAPRAVGTVAGPGGSPA